jgi:hypothetical protein
MAHHDETTEDLKDALEAYGRDRATGGTNARS